MHCIVVEGNSNEESACFDQGLQRQGVFGMTKDKKVLVRRVIQRVMS